MTVLTTGIKTFALLWAFALALFPLWVFIVPWRRVLWFIVVVSVVAGLLTK